jgi:molybdenum cofactor cytidylyltransferase
MTNNLEKRAGSDICVLVVSAGQSSRLGQPKQLLRYQGQSLIRRAVQTAIESSAGNVLVVLGAHAERMEEEIADSTAHRVINTGWQEGMASSLRCGVRELEDRYPETAGVILMVCDQPHVTSALLNDLIKVHRETGKPIVTCSYDNTFGPPVFFHKTLFPELLRLRGDVGARGVIRKYANEVEAVPFPLGAIDVDTVADFKRLSGEQKEF